MRKVCDEPESPNERACLRDMMNPSCEHCFCNPAPPPTPNPHAFSSRASVLQKLRLFLDPSQSRGGAC